MMDYDEDDAIIYKVKASYINVIENAIGKDKVDIYEADGFINPRIRLPAISVQRGERIDSDQRDQSAGFRTYNLPMKTTIFTQPMNKRQIHKDLYRFEEQVCAALHHAEHNNGFHEAVTGLEFISAREGTIYDISTERVFANSVTIMYNLNLVNQVIHNCNTVGEDSFSGNVINSTFTC